MYTKGDTVTIETSDYDDRERSRWLLRRRQRQIIRIVWQIIFTLGLLSSIIRLSGHYYPSNITTSISTVRSQVKLPSKYAYCAFLDQPAIHKDRDSLDPYFISTRMLVYQILHDPMTRSNSSIPIVILVTDNVSEWQRRRLELDGAILYSADRIEFDWIHPDRERWSSVLGKLNVYKLIQYEKVLVLDTDMVVVRPLDGIFYESETDVQWTRNGTSDKVAPRDEGTQPTKYIQSSQSEANPNYYNAGFVVVHPSIEMFDYQVRIASIEGRFDGKYPEQNLWNYIHRREGNMPWRKIRPNWSAHRPTYKQYEEGLATLHAKWWTYQKDERLTSVLYRSRYKMEGFWNGLD